MNKNKNIFSNYAEYYNLLYKDKDYLSEVNFIYSLIEKHQKQKSQTILDIGCGTGNHLFFLSERGLAGTGVDSSEEMIKIAKEREKDNLKFYIGNATDFNLGKTFDVVVSLFHVASYQTLNNDLEKYFECAHKHTNDKGLFIFDFWYGPAVLTDVPVLRVKYLENEKSLIYRIATPTLFENENCVNVNYEVLIENKNSNKVEKIKETHRMRYLFKPEIELFLKNKFKIIDFSEWITGKAASTKSWGVYCVAQKI